MIKNWYVIYTRPRYEKLTYSVLQRKGIECYLPLITEVRQWHDRKKKVQVPVFPGYLFVYIDNYDMVQVYSTEGFVRFISTEEKLEVVSPETIDRLKRAMQGDFEVSTDKFQAGDKVRVASGPMKGLEGNLVRVAQQSKLVVDVDVIGRSVLVTIPAHYIKKAQIEY